MRAVIEVKDLSKTYGDVKAVDQVNLQVERVSINRVKMQKIIHHVLTITPEKHCSLFTLLQEGTFFYKNFIKFINGQKFLSINDTIPHNNNYSPLFRLFRIPQ